MLLNQIISLQLNFIGTIIENLRDEQFIHPLDDNIWGVDLAHMQSLSQYNGGIKYLLCAINLFSKHAWVVPVKHITAIAIGNACQKITSKRKPNEIWVDLGSEFYNNLFKRSLKVNNIEMYSTYIEGKSVVAEKFIRTLKNKIFKHVTAVSKNVSFDVLDDAVDKYNNIVHRSIKINQLTLHLILMLNKTKILM